MGYLKISQRRAEESNDAENHKLKKKYKIYYKMSSLRSHTVLVTLYTGRYNH